ncbi:MAG: hypothetical protein AAF624_17485 [Bacteroidota bacterium]
MGIPTPTPASTPVPATALRLHTLAEEARTLGAPSAVQAVLAAGRCALRDVRHHAASARAAALSLAQHERLDAMRAELDALDAALDSVLEASGRCLVDADTSPEAMRRFPRDGRGRARLRLWHRTTAAQAESASVVPSWGLAVGALLTALDTQTDRLATLASGQPDGAPSRRLADGVTAVLVRHRDALRTETQRCIADLAA